MTSDKDSQSILKLLKEVSEKISDLEIKVDDTKADLATDIFRLRAELKDETKSIKRRLSELKKDQEVIIRVLDGEQVSIKKRLDTIEEALNLPPN